MKNINVLNKHKNCIIACERSVKLARLLSALDVINRRLYLVTYMRHHAQLTKRITIRSDIRKREVAEYMSMVRKALNEK